jgi:hypothetical protein
VHVLGVRRAQRGQHLLRTAHQQSEVRGDGEIVETGRAVLRHLVGRDAHRADRLAEALAALHRIGHRLHHRRMRGLPRIAHRRRKIRRRDEERVDALDRGDRLERAERGRRLDLRDHRDAFVGALQVGGVQAVARGAAHADDAANALRSVARRRHRVPRRVGTLDEGTEQRRRADVEHPLDDHRVVPRHAHHRHHLRCRERLQKLQHAHRIERRVLHVDHAPVEAGVADGLGDDRARRQDPGAERLMAAGGLEQVLEGVHRRLVNL